MKRTVRTLLVLAVLATVLAMPLGSALASKQIFVFTQQNTLMNDWDPSISYGTDGSVFLNTYETLVRFDDVTNEYVPVLATSWETSEDGMTWTFHLREGVVFHDGTPFTALDVKYSLERSKALGLSASFVFNNLAVINVVDDYTAEFVLSEPFNVLEAVSCQYAAFIYCHNIGETLEESSDWFLQCQINGTGPYKLQSYDSSRVILTAHEQYWGGWEGNHFKKAAILLAEESATNRQLLLSGDADLTLDLATTDIESFIGNDAFTIDYVPSANNIVFFNLQYGPCSDINIRKALAFAFPYDKVYQYIGYDSKYLKMPTDTVNPYGIIGQTDAVPYRYDLEQAKAFYDASSYAGQPVEVKIIFGSVVEDHKKFLEMWKAELETIGITLTLVPTGSAALEPIMKDPDPSKRADLYITGMVSDTAYATAVYLSCCDKNGAWNFAWADYPEIDAKLAEAVKLMATDYEAGVRLSKEVGEAYANEFFVINVANQFTGQIFNSHIGGVHFNPFYNCSTYIYDLYWID